MKPVSRASARRLGGQPTSRPTSTLDHLLTLEDATVTDLDIPTDDIEDDDPTVVEAEVLEPSVRTSLPPAPEKPDVPRRFQERLPVKPTWWHDPVSNAKFAGTYAAHVAGYHAIRLPWYLLQLIGWSPRGYGRLVRGIYVWGRDEEARARAEVAENTNDYLKLRKSATLRTEFGIFLCFALTVGFALGMYLPATRLRAVLAFVALCGWAGRPKDRPAIPSAVVTSPSARKITPDVIMRALHAAGLCKEMDGPDAPQFVAPGVHRDGPGFAAIIDLPFGFTAQKAVEKRVELAAGLRVDEFRLFIDRVRDRGHAGRVRLWIADRDPYSLPPVVSPLAKAARCDLWRPIPFGVDERGQLVSFLLVWTSVLIGALPRMGKTVAARVIACAAALDPHTRLVIFDGKGGKDWDPFEKVSHRFGVGPDDEVAEHLRDVLKEVQVEAKRRYKAFRGLSSKRCPESKLTPELSRDRDLNMPLIVIVIDEFQRYLENQEYGKEIYFLLLDLAKVAPAAGVVLVLATQRPSGKTTPTELRDVIGTRYALRVTTREFSEMILGSGSYKAGLDASQFLASHKGVGILLGADDGELTDKGGQTVRSHLIDGPALEGITERARRLREGAGTLSGVAVGEVAKVLSDQVLEHVAQAFRGREKAQSWWLLRNMAQDFPGLYPTEEWEPADLAAALARFGIEGGNQVWDEKPDGSKGNGKGFHLSQVTEALTDRILASAGADDIDEDEPYPGAA